MHEAGRNDSRTPALRLEKVVHSYGAIKAINDVSLVAYPGEFVALLGPNGAGKSTLFQLLSGLFTPDSGRIEVMGQDMQRDPVPALAGLGIVFQQSTLDGELTVMANLLFHTGLHGMPKGLARERIARELARLGLSDSADKKVSTLSGGNKRRVELARALLHEPRLLLMDEPTVGLDPASRGDLLKLILAMCKERNVAVLWATHLCEEVVDADRVVVLHKGKVLRDTVPAALLADTGKATIEEAFLSLTGPQPAAA
jgi:ABC-2 type transport system ATP-binding protein